LLREELQESLQILNRKSRLPLTLIESSRPSNSPLRLNRTIMRKIRKSLLFIADTTPITSIDGQEICQLIPSPNVCVEIGYAVESKKSEQILLAHQQRPELEGQFPFDLPTQQILQFTDGAELNKILTVTIENQLARFKLFC
jgi:hypothetical protein